MIVVELSFSCLKSEGYFFKVLIRVERPMEVVLITVSDMDLNTTVRVALVFSWKAIFTTAQVKKMKGCDMLPSQILLVDIN